MDLTSAAVDLTVEANLDGEKDSRSHKRSANEGDVAEGETDNKRVALQERGMQLEAQSRAGHDGMALSMGGDATVPDGADAVNTDADMGEEPDERWLQREKAAVPVGSKIPLMERMLFGSSKVTFRSAANGANEDTLDIRSAITAERFRAWWPQE